MIGAGVRPPPHLCLPQAPLPPPRLRHRQESPSRASIWTLHKTLHEPLLLDLRIHRVRAEVVRQNAPQRYSLLEFDFDRGGRLREALTLFHEMQPDRIAVAVHQTFRLIGPSHSEIFSADPANIKHILKSNFSKYSKGQYNYHIMKDLFGNGIFAVDGKKWRHQRKLASYEFSTKVLRDFSSVVFQQNAVKLVRRISDAVNTETMIDMQNLLMRSTLDSIFKVGFGVELDTLSGSNEFGVRFSKAFDDSNSIVFWRYADIFWEIKRLLNIGLEAQLKRNLKVIDDFVYQLIHHKREQMKSRRETKSKEDILSRFILASEKDPENMTDRYLRDIILNFLVAGKDTSANTLSWFFFMLCKHPLLQEKIAIEIREVTKFEGGRTDIMEFSACLSEEVIDRMHYLHAALTETLRLYPAVPVDVKISDEDDVLPDGFKVKKGDAVHYITYAMGRMTYLWGEDAEEFRPERWLENGVFRPESPFKFVAFNEREREELVRIP
ncbi:Cytochrome P450 704C1 [Cocos nucifera]|uniref:Cytochrome P450 704C1 n=1 Tax=Cocos nucifera TaxID=13894 RepID=A0A8K0N6X8_COCNU|nr:Cytochrome P450 704C1 [Cocos nucifera]